MLKTFRHYSAKSLLYLIVIIVMASSGWAETEDKSPFNTVTLYWENDFVANTDRNYTNGLKLTFSTPFLTDPNYSRLPKWSQVGFDRLPWINGPDKPRALSLSIGQNIFTPEDTDVEELLENQRPYAGYLYSAVGFQSISENRRDIWEIDIGVVGSASFAQDTQEIIHALTDSEKPRGWQHQLKNEPTLELICESKWRWLHADLGDKFGVDLIPHIGGRAGNVAIYANTGAELRFGWSLPKDFGSCPIRPGCETRMDQFSNNPNTSQSALKLYLFTAVDGRAVWRDIFLDGNTFTDSHSVEKKNFVGDFMTGFGILYKRYKLSYSWVYRTKEFDQQKDPQIFGSIQLSATF